MKCTAIRCLTLALLVMTTAACGQVITRPTPASAPTRVAAALETAAATDTPTATPVPYTPPPTFTPTMTPTPVFYYIEAGDNLFIIADKFNVPHDLLRDVNGITNERALQVGHKIDHYEIIKLVGRGGMGEVYLAQDSQLHRKVAIKLIL
ncbi:MAG: lysM domain receptor-like kinase, partial [Anaerolineae bacterium]